jgi:hypothetical protein
LSFNILARVSFEYRYRALFDLVFPGPRDAKSLVFWR